MPVYPLAFEPVVKTGRYPHMARRDFVVWERWIDAHGREYPRVAYDVALGGVISAIPAVTPAMNLGFQYSTALKIDALLLRAGALTIVEVRPEASVSAIGSALCYEVMILREVPEARVESRMVVCEFASLDIRACAEVLGVEIVKV
jgi:hypothetical protein